MFCLQGLHEQLHHGNLEPKEIERAKAGQVRDHSVCRIVHYSSYLSAWELHVCLELIEIMFSS